MNILVGGVASLGAAVGHLHLLSVAVVSSDEQHVALLLAALVDLGNGLVARLNGSKGGFVLQKVSSRLLMAIGLVNSQLRYVRRAKIVSQRNICGRRVHLSCQEQPGSV